MVNHVVIAALYPTPIQGEEMHDDTYCRLRS